MHMGEEPINIAGGLVKTEAKGNLLSVKAPSPEKARGIKRWSFEALTFASSPPAVPGHLRRAWDLTFEVGELATLQDDLSRCTG